MSNIDSTIYVLNSKERTGGTIQSATYNMINAGTIGPGTFELVSFHSFDQTYNVETGVNSEIYFDEGGAELGPVDILAGNYNETELATAIDVAMNSAAGANTYVTTYNVVTGKYLVDGGGTSTYKFNWDAHVADPTADKLMGFSNAAGVLANTQTSDLLVDLSLHQMLLVDITQDGNQNVTILSGTEFSFMIPLNGNFGEDIDSMKQETFSQNIKFSSNLNSLDVNLFTENGIALVNTPDYTLSIRKLF